jgi:thiosulfate/3-mercaptopyruvate sulfurtransferase
VRASIFGLLLLVGCQRGVTSEVPGYIAQVEQLQAWKVDDAHVIVDVRPAAEFAAGHVPGAVNVEIKALRAEVDGVPEQLAPRAQVEAALAGAGVDVGDQIFVIDADAGPPAARLVWTLQYFGHDPGHVRVLDGGWQAWVTRGEPQTTEVATPTRGTAALGAEQPGHRVDAAWVQAHLGDPKVMLIDVRSDEEWAAGRIPGARHIPWQQAREEDGRMKDVVALELLYSHAMSTPTVAVYCKSGTRASVTWLVLRMIGHPDVRVYDGSWLEWSARADLPQEK